MSSLRLKAATHAGGVHIMAERVGFEPTVRIATYTRFPGVRLKPLIHLSDGRILALRSDRPRAGRKFGEKAGLCTTGIALRIRTFCVFHTGLQACAPSVVELSA